jgi:hypothetical protein
MLPLKRKNEILQEELYKEQIKKGPTKKNWIDKIDPYSKIIQTLIVTTGVVLSVIQFISNSESQRREAVKDYQKSFYQKQTEVYAEAVNTTSLLSVLDTGTVEYEKARQDFLQLFWGRMSMFEDKCVEQKMVAFRKILLKYETQNSDPVPIPDPCNDTTITYTSVDKVSLKMASLQLAHQCRVHTIKTWLVDSEQVKYNLHIYE